MCKLICDTNLRTATSKKANNVRAYFQNLENKLVYDNSFQAKIDRARLKTGKCVSVS